MILSVTVPFFALILFGYVAAARRWVPPESVPAFNGFLLYFAVPAMLFRFAADQPFEEITNGRFVLAWSLAGLVVLLATTLASLRLQRQRLHDAAFDGLCAAVGNSGFLGVPLLVALLGERAAAPTILVVITDLVVVGSVGLALAEAGGASGRGWKADARDAAVRIFLNPFVVAMVLGAIFSGMRWKLATPLAGIVKLLADSAGPCALFAIGVSLVRPGETRRTGNVALATAAKLLVHPLVAYLAMRALGLPEFITRVATLVAALPSAGWVFIFAVRYEADAGRVSATILVSTALAFATFSTLVWLLLHHPG